MARLSLLESICVLVLLCIVRVPASSAQTFTTLVTFAGTNGISPEGVLAQGTDGNFYGTTSGGGSNSSCQFEGCGTVFKVSRTGTVTTLYSFCVQAGCSDGANPQAGLILGTDGNFYGSTLRGGSNGDGTIFRVTPAGKLTTLHSFNMTDGFQPVGRLTLAADGSFYGTTINGGDVTCDPPYGCGTVFKITSKGALTTLHIFEGQPDGEGPFSGLTLGSDGNFYGTTESGGKTGWGLAYRITAQGRFQTVHSFSDDINGCEPFGGLVQASDGNLYGTTAACGITNDDGTVFKLSASGELTTLHSFDNYDGNHPDGTLIQATDGNLYETTIFGGTDSDGIVFTITPSGDLTTLHDFDFSDGVNPAAGLLQATNGMFYGTATQGGLTCISFGNGCGTVFSVSMGLNPFVAFIRGSGKVGQTGGILGQGFAGSTGVSFNGVPASFTIGSDTFIRATVPSGATSGYVTVTTPGGMLTSNVPFQVIQ